MSILTCERSKQIVLLALSASWLIYAAVFASTGFFIVDELIYGAMIDQFASTGGWVIQNGYDAYPSDSLRLGFLVAGPHGLVAQYPGGYAAITTPFYWFGGFRGVILLNTLAIILTLAVTYRLTRLLFDDEDLALNAALIFGLATFAGEYAFGIWPHALSVLFATTAILAAVMSVRGSKTSALFYAGLAGVITGAGINVRLDMIIVAVPIVLWFIGNSKRPVSSIGLFALGAVPGLALAAWINQIKFGSWMVLSYGSEGGATSLGTYGALLPLAIPGLAAAIAFGFPKFRQLLLGYRGAIYVGVGAATLLVIPVVSELALIIFRGLYVLVIDFQSYDRIQDPGISYADDGTMLMWGRLKKSLVQSLPYLGFLLLPFVRLFQPENRSAFALCFLVPTVWFVPFAFQQWHGGMANNMRYFLYVLPLLSILAAYAWQEINAASDKCPRILQYLAVFVAVALVLGVTGYVDRYLLPEIGITAIWNAQLVIAMTIAGLSAALSLLWIPFARARPYLRTPAVSVFAAGLVYAALLAYHYDSRLSQRTRADRASVNQTNARIEGNALVLTSLPEKAWFQLRRPDGIVGVIASGSRAIDVGLIEWALDAGRPVYVESDVADRDLIDAPAGSDLKIIPRAGLIDLVEVGYARQAED